MSQVLPEQSATVGDQQVDLGTPPGQQAPPAPERRIEGRSPLQLGYMRFKRDKVAVASFFFIIFLCLVAVFAPVFAHVTGHKPNVQNLAQTDEFGIPKGPDLEHKYFFGADPAGRDLMVRVAYGARISLTIAILATGLALVIGTVVGMVAGFFRGGVDMLLSRTMDVLMSIPILLLALALIAVFSPSLWIIISVIAFVNWTYIARIVRGQVLSLREKEFVEASRSLGAGSIRIIFRDLLPNLVAPIIVYATLIIPANILFEATLSFLGLGLPPPTASWGQMLSEAESFYQVAWWMLVFPGLALLSTTLAFNLLGDGLRDALDPRGQHQV